MVLLLLFVSVAAAVVVVVLDAVCCFCSHMFENDLFVLDDLTHMCMVENTRSMRLLFL